MSWERAKKEARSWVDGLNLPTRRLRGQKIDLNEQAKTLRFEAKFRTMVIRAAKRLLFNRGVMAEIDEPTPLGQFPEEEAQD